MNEKLLKNVFGYSNESITIIYDIPIKDDNKDWKWRRDIAKEWANKLNCNLAC